MQRTRRIVAYLSAAVTLTAAVSAHAQDSGTSSGSTSSSTRATVVELPPAAEDQGIVRLSTAATAEDVIQPVLEIERGKTVLLKPAYDVKRIAVGDPEIVDFVVNGSNEIQLIAKSVGNTNVLIWDSANRLQASIDIHVGAVRAQLVRELRRVLGRNDISVDMAGESVVLRGTVPDLQTSEAAQAVATAFFVGGDGGGGGEGGAVAAAAGGGKEARVINLLSVGGNNQVMLHVVIAEMSRTVRRAIGANFDITRINSNTVNLTNLVRQLVSPDVMSAPGTGMGTGMGGMGTGTGGTGTGMGTTSPGQPVQVFTLSNAVTLAFSLFDEDDALNLFIEALEANRLGKVLAEPTLVARSGELASFLVGGEIPIPVPSGDDNEVTITFKRFGVQLEFIPTVLSADRIHMQVTPEVSQPDFTFGTSVSGTTVPAFRTRRAATGIELADGQSFAIGGLLQDLVTTDYERIPLLGAIPILGNLFRSERFQRDETELVIIVTPHLVQPLGPEPVTLPTDRYVEPTKLSFFLLGRIQGPPPAPAPPTAPADGPSQNIVPPGPPVAPGQEPALVGGLIGNFGHRLRLEQPQGDQ